MFFLNKNKKTAPKWFKYGMLAFIAFAVINAMFRDPTEFDRQRMAALERSQAEALQAEKERGPQNPYTADTVPNLNDYPEMRKAMDIDRWKRMFNSGNVMNVVRRELVIGEGPTAQCGQKVTAVVRGTRDVDGANFDPDHDETTPLVFRIGDGSQVPAIDQSVLGMRVGGKRATSAAEHLVYPEVGDAFKMESVRFNVALEALEPTVPEGMIAFTRTIRHTKPLNENSTAARCGQEVTIDIAVADTKGTFGEVEQVTLTLGDPTQPHGITRSLLGAPVGAEVTATIPPSYAKMSNGSAKLQEIFNGEQIVIVRMERTQ